MMVIGVQFFRRRNGRLGVDPSPIDFASAFSVSHTSFDLTASVVLWASHRALPSMMRLRVVDLTKYYRLVVLYAVRCSFRIPAVGGVRPGSGGKYTTLSVYPAPRQKGHGPCNAIAYTRIRVLAGDKTDRPDRPDSTDRARGGSSNVASVGGCVRTYIILPLLTGYHLRAGTGDSASARNPNPSV